MKTVVVAMDKFKGSATADQVCSSVCAGIDETTTDVRCVSVPLADGGDGTVAALSRAGWELVSVPGIDAQGVPVTAAAARRGDTVVVELADICGIARWRGERDPWRAHTMGVGHAIRALIDGRVRRIVVAAGGSASTDGGLGLLMGLGFRVTDDHGVEVEPGLVGLRAATRIETPADMEILRSCEWTVLVDVDSPLCGPYGAARRFGPQKGLSSDDVVIADGLLTGWESVLARTSGRGVGEVGSILGTGAAGGIAAPLVALLDASIESGFDFIATQFDLKKHLTSADFVVTGEGRVDASSLTGKVVGAVLSLATQAKVPSAVVAGSVDERIRSQIPPLVISLVDLAEDEGDAMTNAQRYLRQAGRAIGAWLA